MDLQAMFDGLGKAARMQREEYEMTLGRMIEALKELPGDALVPLNNAHSYRGYYEDLAFQYGDPQPVADLLNQAENCVGTVFTGYKGGDYTMDSNTPVWVAPYGSSSGMRLRGFREMDGGADVVVWDVDHCEEVVFGQHGPRR